MNFCDSVPKCSVIVLGKIHPVPEKAYIKFCLVSDSECARVSETGWVPLHKFSNNWGEPDVINFVKKASGSLNLKHQSSCLTFLEINNRRTSNRNMRK